MAKEARVQDEISAAGFDDLEMAKPVRDSRGNVTGYVKRSVPKGAYEAQMELAEEDRDPRYADLKKASELKKSDFLENRKEETRAINKAVNEPNPEVEQLRKELAELKALVKGSSGKKKGEEEKTPTPPAADENQPK